MDLVKKRILIILMPIISNYLDSLALCLIEIRVGLWFKGLQNLHPVTDRRRQR